MGTAADVVYRKTCVCVCVVVYVVWLQVMLGFIQSLNALTRHINANGRHRMVHAKNDDDNDDTSIVLFI